MRRAASLLVEIRPMSTNEAPSTPELAPHPRWRGLVLPAAVALATAAAAILSHRAITWAPLNVDEEMTRFVAGHSFSSILDIVSNKRGGGPLHFWLVHVTLSTFHGLIGLRGPSLAFFVLALPAAALVARELADEWAAVGAVILLATSPLGMSYASFGRPHTMLLAWLLWSTVLALRAVRLGGRVRFGIAGAALGTSIFVHPTAPLYALSAGLAAVIVSPLPWRTLLRDGWVGVVTCFVGFVPYEIKTAHVLGERYGISAGAQHGRTFTRLPVWHDALATIAPGRHAFLNVFTIGAALGMLSLLGKRRRSAVAMGIIIAAPVAFFTWVPANGLAAIFFDRYMLPALPAFLTLVAAGVAALTAHLGRLRPLVFALVISGVAYVGIHIVTVRQGQLHDLRLPAVASAIAEDATHSVVFSAAGSTQIGAYPGQFSYGRPADLIGRYVQLSHPEITLVDDESCQPVVSWLTLQPEAAHGVWVFYAVRDDELARAQTALAQFPEVTVTVPAHRYFLLRSKDQLAPRALLALGITLRQAWLKAVPMNPRAQLLIDADTTALHDPNACVATGPLGDPGISPNYPLTNDS